MYCSVWCVHSEYVLLIQALFQLGTVKGRHIKPNMVFMNGAREVGKAGGRWNATNYLLMMVRAQTYGMGMEQDFGSLCFIMFMWYIFGLLPPAAGTAAFAAFIAQLTD